MDLPSNSTSTIALPALPYGDAPWRGMDLAVEFMVGPDPATAQVIHSPSPLNSGRRGLPITLQTDPPGTSGACLDGPLSGALRTVSAGKDVFLTGRTDPAVAGQLVTIRAARLGESGPRDLANVRVGGDGAFSYRWRPGALGDYALGALYRSQSPELTDDFSQAKALRVVLPPRVVPPPRRSGPVAVTAARRRVGCRGERCVIVVRGSVKRPPGAGAARCTGKLRVRVAAGDRRLLSSLAGVTSTCRYRARRRFTLKSTRPRFVTVRVSYLGDLVLEPSRGQAVRLKVHR